MTASILTNMSAMSALQNLAATQKSLNMIQSQVSSGLRVATASDNAAYFSIATSMKSDTAALSAVTDALNLGSSVVGVASSAIGSVIENLKKMKALVVTAQTAGTSKTQVQSQITADQQSLQKIISSASFNGVNLLDGSTTQTNIVASFSRTATATSTGTLLIDTVAQNIAMAGGTAAGGVLGGSMGAASANGPTTVVATTYDSSGTTPQSGFFASDSIINFQMTDTSTAADLTIIATAIDTAITATTAAAAKLGATTTTIDNQLTFVSALSDAITSGVGSLVDADMNVASTKLQALQTQQQLGIQSLSIANQNSQLILKLFNN